MLFLVSVTLLFQDWATALLLVLPIDIFGLSVAVFTVVF